MLVGKSDLLLQSVEVIGCMLSFSVCIQGELIQALLVHEVTGHQRLPSYDGWHHGCTLGPQMLFSRWINQVCSLQSAGLQSAGLRFTDTRHNDCVERCRVASQTEHGGSGIQPRIQKNLERLSMRIHPNNHVRLVIVVDVRVMLARVARKGISRWSLKGNGSQAMKRVI